MYNIIAVFFPSLISIKMDEKYIKQDDKINILINYLIYCMLNNMMVLTFFIKIFKANPNIWYNLNKYPGMMIKYSLLSIFVATILSLINIIIKKNVEVEIEIKNK